MYASVQLGFMYASVQLGFMYASVQLGFKNTSSLKMRIFTNFQENNINKAMTLSDLSSPQVID